MAATPSYNDAELLRLFKEGDEVATAALYRRYYKGLVFFSMEILHEQLQAEDIAQEAFLKVWERRHLFSSLAQLKSYLYVSVKNASLNVLSHRGVQQQSSADLQRLQQDEKHYIETRMLYIELMTSVYNEIRALPPPYAEVLQLLFQEELSAAEAAEKLALSPENLRIRKFRAINMLRSELLKKGLSGSLFIYFIFFVTNP